MSPSSAVLSEAKQKYAAGDIRGALAALESGIRGQIPPPRDALRMRAHLWIACQEIANAEQDLDTILKHYPQDAESYDDRGVLFQMRQDYMQAAMNHLKAVEINPTHDGYLLNLAIALDYLGQKHNAEQLYRDIIMLNPNNTRALTNLGIILDERGEYTQAETYLQQAIALGEANFELCMAAANLYRKQGKSDTAITWYEKALAKRPDNPQARFLLDALKGKTPEAPPEEHISGLFDSYAETFEKSLVDKLKYRAPDLLFTLIKMPLEEMSATEAPKRALDLGAGTGLFGKLIRPYFKTSIGLDLSEKMLLKAQEQKIYDEVICTDMLRGLKEFPDNHFHLISAADVFVYQGRLDDIFAEVHRTLVPGGLFAFSTEALHTDDPVKQFALNDTGRYTHSENYLKQLATEHHFRIHHLEHNWLRYNKDVPLDGHIAVLSKI